MLQKLHLTSVGPTRSLGMEFGPGTNVMTGDNGLGKTFLLDIAWWALSRTWASHPILPAADREAGPPAIEVEIQGAGGHYTHHFAFDADTQTWPFDRGRPPIAGLVLYARVDGGFGVWDPLRSSDPETGTRKNMPFLFSPSEVWNGLEIDGRVACRGLVDDVVTWQLRGGDQIRQFAGVLRRLAPDGHALRLADEPGRTSLKDVRDVPFLHATYGDVPLTHASAGVKRVAQLAYLLVWAWQEHQRAAETLGVQPQARMVLLIDEIEAHLHPRWQKQILPALRSVVDELSSDTVVQLIVATHSPLVLASVDPIFDPQRDRLFTLDLQEEGPDIGHPVAIQQEWAPRSDSGAWLGSDAFDGLSGRPPQVHHAIDQFGAAVDANDREGALSAYSELARLASPDDADLLRLRAVLRRHDWYGPASPAA